MKYSLRAGKIGVMDCLANESNKKRDVDSKSPDIPVLWFVVPCYNEQEMLPTSFELFSEELDRIVSAGKARIDSRILFVNDGSTDETWQMICAQAEADEHVMGMSLSRNRGHQNALLAGLMEARGQCDIAISVDCDGQDDLRASERMIDEYLVGADVVYGVRSNRDADTAFKRTTAEAFYKLMARLGAEVVFNHADYRLMSARALDGLAEFGETNLFLRGLVPLVGFPSATVEYVRHERIAGSSHYPIGKMVGLAVDGITNLSIKPMRIIMVLGMVFFAFGLALVVYALVTFASGNAVAGWASTICIISIIGGLQLLALGIIGEYIGKIYLETKSRPRFIVSERTWDERSRVE